MSDNPGSRFYLDNTLLHRLLPLVRGEVSKLTPGNVPANIARALECALLSDQLVLNPLEPSDIHSITESIVEWFKPERVDGLQLDLQSLKLEGQQEAADIAAHEILVLVEDTARGQSLRSAIPSLDTVVARWQDAVPAQSGRLDWTPLWDVVNEPDRIREEVCQKWIEEEQSGKLLFACWCRSASMCDWLRRHVSWLRLCSKDELEGLRLMYFVVLNQHIARQQGATYSSTDTRVLLAQDAQRSLYRALCSKIASLRKEVAQELGVAEGGEPTVVAPCCPIGLVDLAIAEYGGRTGLPTDRVLDAIIEFWGSESVRDLRRVLARIGALAHAGDDEESMRATLRELRDVEEGVRRRLGLSKVSRRVDVEHTNWRKLLFALFREPGRWLEILRQERTVRSPRVAMLTRATARK